MKEYIKGDKHVHQAGSIMIKFAQYNVPGQKGDWKRQEEKEAEENMVTFIKVKGMMCQHCEASVKKALEAVDGVESAQVSHEKGCAVVSLSAEVADEVLKKAVEDKDYKVVGIK